jgi:catechol 2,3-dioxygenase-like lactoylglutathione lyase family enzyme
MIDHVLIRVSNLGVSAAFYKQALAPLGYEASAEFTSETSRTKTVAFSNVSIEFMIAQGPLKLPPNHLAFRVTSRAIVKAFYKAAIAAGGRNNGRPKLYPEYHRDYFGAFVFDPDGHNIEAVCHEEE